VSLFCRPDQLQRSGGGGNDGGDEQPGGGAAGGAAGGAGGRAGGLGPLSADAHMQLINARDRDGCTALMRSVMALDNMVHLGQST
jgi:hypothetical protein